MLVAPLGHGQTLQPLSLGHSVKASLFSLRIHRGNQQVKLIPDTHIFNGLFSSLK